MGRNVCFILHSLIYVNFMNDTCGPFCLPLVFLIFSSDQRALGMSMRVERASLEQVLFNKVLFNFFMVIW